MTILSYTIKKSTTTSLTSRAIFRPVFFISFLALFSTAELSLDALLFQCRPGSPWCHSPTARSTRYPTTKTNTLRPTFSPGLMNHIIECSNICPKPIGYEECMDNCAENSVQPADPTQNDGHCIKQCVDYIAPSLSCNYFCVYEFIQ